jgi:hypothetical protein
MLAQPNASSSTSPDLRLVPGLRARIRALPEELAVLIAAYTASPQPRALMRDLRDYCCGARALREEYIRRVGEKDACNVMALDVFLFANRGMVMRDGFSHDVYEMMMRDPRLHTLAEADTRVIEVYRRRDGCAAFALFWGMMTYPERAAFAAYSATVLDDREAATAEHNANMATTAAAAAHAVHEAVD